MNDALCCLPYTILGNYMQINAFKAGEGRSKSTPEGASRQSHKSILNRTGAAHSM